MFKVMCFAALAVVAMAQNTTMMIPVQDSNSTAMMSDPSTTMDTTTTVMVVPDNGNTTNSMPVAVQNTTSGSSPSPSPSVDKGTSMIPTDVSPTTPAVPCNDSIGRLDEVFAFTSLTAFTDNLSENEQILVYEVLAAAEGCKMAAFITPETAERIFRMLGSLPTRYVYTMLNYMAEALANEGVVVPT